MKGPAPTPPLDDSKLGTFGGVFTPSLLTILGLVLFLRLGYVTGNVGLVGMIAIITIATSVSILTTVSLAAIATNLRVGGGGVYFLISRTLGPAAGASIGLVLYLAMSVSIAFYAIGLGEAVTSIVAPGDTTLPRLIAAVVVIGLLALAWQGADLATRLQFVVMACLVVAIGGYFAGVLPDVSGSQLTENFWAPDGGDSFWLSFAIFFPAITGFTQGVAMSGDLRTPSRSITVGTFSAIGISTAVYVAVVATFAMAVPLTELRGDTSIMRGLALHPALVDVGVIAATLSSAIASMLGAPRTLQRLAADRLIKPLEPLAKGAGPSDNPRRATILSAGIALATIALGDLNLIAPVISMFFLASYGLINYATFSEARAASTSFRPTFRWFDRRLSLLGTIACAGTILAIDPLAGAAAGLLVYGLFRAVQRSPQQARWTDSTRGFHAAEVRDHLRQMTGPVSDDRDWRPVAIAFAPRDPVRRARLVEAASWLEGGVGFTTVTRIVRGQGAAVRQQASKVQLELDRELLDGETGAFGRVIVADTLADGVGAMVQAHGLGPLRANVALFSWFDPDEANQAMAEEHETMVRTGMRFGCHVGVVQAGDRAPAVAGTPLTIVVWWSDDRTGQLLTLFAWLCTRTPSWRRAEIVVCVPTTSPERTTAPTSDAETVRRLLEEARIPGRVHEVDPDDFDVHNDAADLFLGPLRVRKRQMLGPGERPLASVAPRYGTSIFISAADDVALDVQPDDSAAAEIAELRDRAQELEDRAVGHDLEAGRLLVEVERLRIGGAEVDAADLEAAQAAATAMQRRYLDTRARADQAWESLRERDPTAVSSTIDPTLWVADESGDPSRP